MTAFVLNTNALDLLGLKSYTEDVYLNDATVTFTVQDKGGVMIGGVDWPQAMTYVDQSNGDYQGILPAAAQMLPGKMYYAIIDAQGGGERLGHWELPFKPLTRTGLPEGDTAA